MSTPEQPRSDPMVGDAERDRCAPYRQESLANAWEWGFDYCRQRYEDLITSGKLRVVEEVEWDRKKPGCAKCGHPWSVLLTISTYCPGCGNPIKRPSPADQVEKRG